METVQEYVDQIHKMMQKLGHYEIEIGKPSGIPKLYVALELIQKAPYNYRVSRIHYADDKAGRCRNCRSDDCDDPLCMDYLEHNGCRLCESDDCECGLVTITKN